MTTATSAASRRSAGPPATVGVGSRTGVTRSALDVMSADHHLVVANYTNQFSNCCRSAQRGELVDPVATLQNGWRSGPVRRPGGSHPHQAIPLASTDFVPGKGSTACVVVKLASTGGVVARFVRPWLPGRTTPRHPGPDKGFAVGLQRARSVSLPIDSIRLRSAHDGHGTAVASPAGRCNTGAVSREPRRTLFVADRGHDSHRHDEDGPRRPA